MQLKWMIISVVIWTSLSKPYTSSELSGTSVTFTKIYKVIRINGRVCKRLRLKTDKTRLLTNASSHYTKNYNVSVQVLHIRLVRMFITQRNTVYCASLYSLYMCYTVYKLLYLRLTPQCCRICLVRQLKETVQCVGIVYSNVKSFKFIM